ncbi:MAG: acyltransferase domain-containing protein [Pseudomonadota bacterium]
MIFCFAGQGSQYRRMGEALFQDHAVFRRWIEIGDEIVRSRSGVSVIDALFGPQYSVSDPFDQIEETHPALFLVQYALAKTLDHHGVQADAYLGTSLGELVAMALSGMVTFEVATTIVADQARVFSQTCAPGGMLAVLANPNLFDELAVLRDTSEIVSINSAGHFVLAAPAEALPELEAVFRARSIPMQALPVGYAFHSRWIDPARELLTDMCPFAGRLPRIPIWSSRTAAPIGLGTSGLLFRVARDPMQVGETFQAVEGTGGAHYVDVSPTGTFAALLRQNPMDHSVAIPTLSPFGKSGSSLDAALALAKPRAVNRFPRAGGA